MRKFKKGEDFEPHVGEEFTYNGKTLKCVLDTKKEKYNCRMCSFNGKCYDSILCTASTRTDNEAVHFVEVKEEPRYELCINGYKLMCLGCKTLDDYKELIKNLNINSGDIFEIKEMKTVYKEVTKDVNEEIDTYEKALKYIGSASRDKMVDSSVALCRLLIIAAAWNKADGFVVDWSNRKQLKHTPVFQYVNGAFVFSCASCLPNFVTTTNFHLCFKTPERAEQFGTQFIDLWNVFLLNK